MPRTSRNNRRRGRRGRNNRSGNGLKIAAASIFTLAALTGGAIAMNMLIGIEEIDSDYCFARSNQEVTAVFLDSSTTHQLARPQLRDVRTAIADARTALPANGRLMVFNTSTANNGSLAKPVYSGCRPPVSEAENNLIDGPDKPAPYLARQAEAAQLEFDMALDAIMEDAEDVNAAAGDSPILEQLQRISRYVDFTGRSPKLVVITDGIQNTEIARFCSVQGDMPSFDSFKQRRGYRHVTPRSYDGISVQYLLIEHGPLPMQGLDYCTNEELRTWWPDYFYGNGASEVQMTRLRRPAGQ